MPADGLERLCYRRPGHRASETALHLVYFKFIFRFMMQGSKTIECNPYDLHVEKHMGFTYLIFIIIISNNSDTCNNNS